MGYVDYTVAPPSPEKNYLGLDGIEFVEFTSAEPEALHKLFLEFGFSRTHSHGSKKIDLYVQNNICFLLNKEADSFASEFAKQHGPSICSMGWKVKDSKLAFSESMRRGAKQAEVTDHTSDSKSLPTIMGIGDSLIYFVENDSKNSLYDKMGFVALEKPDRVEPKGFQVIDHLTNNVYNGTMKQWSDFYKNIFGFEEIRYFDIKGQKTGLQSYALRSPCGKFSIPINEAQETKSQINEYLDVYGGPGVQHLALVSEDILSSLRKMENTNVEMLDISESYYKSVFQRVPNVKEDHQEIQRLNVLVDGDQEGYLLQIFTKNIIGPIFFEIIQRKNHHSFGEGNFQALFESIERDQEKRGVFKE